MSLVVQQHALQNKYLRGPNITSALKFLTKGRIAGDTSEMPLSLGDPGPRLRHVHSPNRISIGSSVSSQLTTTTTIITF